MPVKRELKCCPLLDILLLQDYPKAEHQHCVKSKNYGDKRHWQCACKLFGEDWSEHDYVVEESYSKIPPEGTLWDSSFAEAYAICPDFNRYKQKCSCCKTGIIASCNTWGYMSQRVCEHESSHSCCKNRPSFLSSDPCCKRCSQPYDAEVHCKEEVFRQRLGIPI